MISNPFGPPPTSSSDTNRMPQGAALFNMPPSNPREEQPDEMFVSDNPVHTGADDDNNMFIADPVPQNNAD